MMDLTRFQRAAAEAEAAAARLEAEAATLRRMMAWMQAEGAAAAGVGPLPSRPDPVTTRTGEGAPACGATRPGRTPLAEAGTGTPGAAWASPEIPTGRLTGTDTTLAPPVRPAMRDPRPTHEVARSLARRLARGGVSART